MKTYKLYLENHSTVFKFKVIYMAMSCPMYHDLVGHFVILGKSHR